MRVRSYLLLLLLMVSQQLPGQVPALRFEHLGVADGLSHTLVTSILQDDLGFLWIGTQDGLNRYDGSSFKVLYPEPSNPRGLQQPWVTVHCKDRRGHLWLSYGNGGLAAYDPQAEVFRSYRHDPQEPHSLSGDQLSQRRGRAKQLVEDPAGRLWIGTRRGLNRYRPETDDFERILFTHLGPGRSAQPEVICIAPGQEGDLWLGTSEGLIRYWPESDRASLVLSLASERGDLVLSLEVVGRDSVWVGTMQSGLYLVRLEPGEERITSFLERFYPHEMPGSEVAVHELMTDRQGRLWLATSNGLFVCRPGQQPERVATVGRESIAIMHQDHRGLIWAAASHRNALWTLDPQTLATQGYTHDPTQPNTPSPNKIKVLFEDSKGVFWLGHEKGGLTWINRYALPFVHLHQNHSATNEMPSSDGYGIYAGDNGEVWIGTYNGLYVKNFRTGAQRVYGQGDRKPGYLSVEQREPGGRLAGVIQPDGQGGLWLGFFDHKVSHYDPVTGLFRNYQHAPAQEGAFKIWSLRDILVARDGTVYFAGTNFGLCILDPGADTFRYVPIDRADSTALPDEWIYDLIEDQMGYIWVGTRKSGLSRYDPRTGHFRTYRHLPGDPGTLCDNSVRCILEQVGPEGPVLWIGTINGLSCFDPVRETFRSYHTADGLPSTVIHGLLADARGHIWISSNGGLTCLDPMRGVVATYTQEDGLQSNEFNERSYFKGPDGRLYFGGVNGVTVFHPDSIQANPYTPDLVISEFRVNNQVVRPGDTLNGRVLLSRAISYLDTLTLYPADKVISFALAAFHYAAPAKIRYRYRLVPFESQWTVLDPGKRDIHYTNLPPGTYQLEVACSDLNGKWAGDSKTLVVEVRPPFWATTWFKLLLVGALILTTLAIIHIRTRNLSRKQIILSRLVKARTQALEDKSAQLEQTYCELEARQAEIVARNEEIAAQRDRLAQHNAELARQKVEVEWMAERMHESDQSKLDFFTNISHEFRTPLTLILGQTERLLNQEQFADPAGVKENLRLMYRSEMRLFRLINQLLEIRSVEAGNLDVRLETCDVVAFCRELGQLFEPLAQRQQVAFHFRPDREHLETPIDPDKLEKILFNLLSNAFKHVPAGKAVGLELALVEQELVFRVINAGAAISEQDLPHIFDRFFHANHSLNGALSSGIGLALVKDLVEQLGGRIAVCEVPDGTCFQVSLPVHDATSVQAAVGPRSFNFARSMMAHPAEAKASSLPTPEPVAPVRKDLPVVLVVDDQVDMRTFLAQGLGAHYRVLLAEDGRQGLERARRYVPDLIICDVMMPELDGLAMTQMLKEDPATSHIPILLLTAKARREDEMTGLEAGADDYLTKPFHLEALDRKLQNMLATRQRLIEVVQASLPLVPPHIQVKEIDQDLLSRIVKVIEDHLDDPELDGDLLAREVGLSKGSLYRKLKALSGLTVNLFIRQVRLRIAARLLETGTYAISDVAYAVGFENPKYFSVCFKEAFGQSPREYMLEKGGGTA